MLRTNSLTLELKQQTMLGLICVVNFEFLSFASEYPQDFAAVQHLYLPLSRLAHALERSSLASWSHLLRLQCHPGILEFPMTF